jgi:hypothetical protein
MPDTELPIIDIGLPQGLCYTNPTDDIPTWLPYLRAVFNGNEINTGDSTPAAEDRDKPWLRTNSDGTPDGVWQFYNGYWVKQHSDFVGKVVMYEGTLVSIDTIDGGEAGAVTNISGPMWEVVSEMAARSPMHPGTLPSGLVVHVGDDLGEEKHVQIITEMIQHSHDITAWTSGATGGDGGQILNEPDPGVEVTKTTEPEGGASATDPIPDGMNVVHPVRGIWFIRKTARTHYRRVA